MPRAVTLISMKKMMDPEHGKTSPVHLSPAEKVREANILYCQKGDTKDDDAIARWSAPWLEVAHKVKHQGKRTDWDKIAELVLEKQDFYEVIIEYPEYAMKYATGIRAMIAAAKEREGRDRLIAEFSDTELRWWQTQIINEINRPADSRRVTWIWENQGGVGKTWLAKYICAKHNAARFTNGRTCDIAFAYNGEPVVVFDLSRTVEGHVNYSVMEELKNGMLFSTKYVSTQKVFASPHILVFANWPPNRGAMSADRWDVRELGSPAWPIDKRVADSTQYAHAIDVECDIQSRNTGPTDGRDCDYQDVDNIFVGDDELPLDI